MNDLIRRQDAIELAMQYCPDDDGTCSKAGADIREMLDELEDLPSAQPEPKWIPCNERLPEDVQIGDEYPIVIFCTKEKTYTGFYEYYLGGRWWTADCDSVVDRVLAWMPLPKPWKGEANEHDQ